MPVSRIHVPGKGPGYLYMLQLRLLFIEQRRLVGNVSCFLALTPCCVCADAQSNAIKPFSSWTLTVHKHYATSTSLLDTERDDVISSQSYLCCITTILLIRRTVAKQHHSNASTGPPSPLSLCSCLL